MNQLILKEIAIFRKVIRMLKESGTLISKSELLISNGDIKYNYCHQKASQKKKRKKKKRKKPKVFFSPALETIMIINSP